MRWFGDRLRPGQAHAGGFKLPRQPAPEAVRRQRVQVQGGNALQCQRTRQVVHRAARMGQQRAAGLLDQVDQGFAGGDNGGMGRPGGISRHESAV